MENAYKYLSQVIICLETEFLGHWIDGKSIPNVPSLLEVILWLLFS